MDYSILLAIEKINKKAMKKKYDNNDTLNDFNNLKKDETFLKKTHALPEEQSYSPKAYQAKSLSIMIVKRDKSPVDLNISKRLAKLKELAILDYKP